MQNLQRITTEYIDTEDRIRLSGDVGQGVPVVIWMTQRLLQRLCVPLLQWLEATAGGGALAEVMHGFAQEAARVDFVAQSPVRMASGSVSWLACAIDCEGISPARDFLRLTFRSAAGVAKGEQAVLVLHAKPLRQWLNILHDASASAGWPMTVWPDWFRDGTSARKQQERGMLMH